MEKVTFHKQLKIVFDAFAERPKTMLQVAIETGILRANICRYVRTFRKRGLIQLVEYGNCPISKHKAGFLTTNKDQFPDKSKQTELGFNNA